MKPSWHFRLKRPGETNRESVHGEFFSSDAIGDMATALVREGIQNALDAGTAGECVTVRIYVSEGERVSQRADPVDLFDIARDHFAAPENGLNPERLPAAGEPLRFLAFEDFGTSGLEGDSSEPFQPRGDETNRFYHFFRAEGQSDKEASDRGSWGVGKHVFLRTSRVGTMFGLTVRRSDGRRMLMGKTVLKSHYLHNDYFQDGYFGLSHKVEGDLVLPVEDPAELDWFAGLFKLERKSHDPGLSVIVPWPHSEIDEEALVQAVVRQYFYPILTGDLEVWVRTPSVSETFLDAANFAEEGRRLDPDSTELIDLAVWANGLSASELVVCGMPPEQRSWKWSESLFGADQLAVLRERFNAGDRVALRVPVTVRKRSGKPLRSAFSVYFVRDRDSGPERPTFVRDGIVISDVAAPRTRGVRSLVVAEPGALAAFLGRSENPSHTQWNADRLKPEYAHGCVGDLKFVTTSVQRIVAILAGSEADEDETLLDDVFFLRHGQRGDVPSERPSPEPKPRPVGFRIEQRSGGFAVATARTCVRLPRILRVRVAYDVRRGSPLKRYSLMDFRLEEPPVRVEVRNIDVLRCRDNELKLKILDRDFLVEVSGFDVRRQLYVSVVEDDEGRAD